MRRFVPLFLVACNQAPVTADTDVACDPATPSLDVPDFHAPVELIHEEVAPSQLDAQTNLQPEDKHQIFVLKSGATRDPLYIMLPGTDGRPANNQQLLTIAAKSGYRAIGLAYPTESNQTDLCGNVDQACATAFTKEKIYGTDETDVIAVDEPNSVVGRLVRLLHALDVRNPDGGWGQYLNGSEPVWDRLIVSGFSQGSGFASWLAKDHALARFVTFSTGCDNLGTTVEDSHPADWCFEPRATPASRSFGILHLEDFFEVKKKVFLDALHLDDAGGFADADTQSPAYCTRTHILTTGLPSRGGGGGEGFHQSLATDAEMPVDSDGVPLLAEDQWYLMAGGE